MSASTRWLAVVATVIAVTVLAGIAVTLAAGGAETYAEGTPERTVQDYLRAVSDRDATAANSLLASDLAKRCSSFGHDPIANRGGNALRATLDRAVVRGETADVHVRITETYGSGPFSSSESNPTVVFNLARTEGQWRITEPAWPLYCPPERVPPAPGGAAPAPVR